MVLTTPVKNACILSTKNAYALVHVRLCIGAEASLPRKLLRTYLEFCARIVQAVVCHPPSCQLDEISRVSSSLSKVHTCAWPRTSPSTKFYFCHDFRGLFFAVCCSELLMSNPSLGFCTAAYCSVLQCVAVCCSVLLTQVTTLSRRVSSSVLQRVVACCSALLTIVHFSLGVCVIVYFRVL